MNKRTPSPPPPSLNDTYQLFLDILNRLSEAARPLGTMPGDVRLIALRDKLRAKEKQLIRV